jgi:hypothetical protein
MGRPPFKKKLVIKEAQIEKFFDDDTPRRTRCGGRKWGGSKRQMPQNFGDCAAQKGATVRTSKNTQVTRIDLSVRIDLRTDT